MRDEPTARPAASASSKSSVRSEQAKWAERATPRFGVGQAFTNWNQIAGWLRRLEEPGGALLSRVTNDVP